jgi:hypothetical protein
MASRRSLVVDAIVAALGAVGKPVGTTVHRSRTTPIEADGLPAMVVYRLSESILKTDGPRASKVKRGLVVRVECRAAAATDGETLEDALDPLTSWAVAGVLADPTLGGLTDSVQEQGTQWATADTNLVYGAAVVDFLVPYITAAGNPDAAT